MQNDAQKILGVRHVVDIWPPAEEIAALSEVLPGSCGWISLSGDVPEERRDVISLQAKAGTMLYRLRQAYRKAVQTLPPADIVIYHHPWGTDLFGREDGAIKRIFWQHQPSIGSFAAVDRLARTVDTFWFDRNPWRDALQASHSWIPSRRLRHLPVVLWSVARTLPAATPAPARIASSETPPVLGWVGRFQLDGERADRWVPLAEALKAAGFKGQIELCGEKGPLEKEIRTATEGLEVRFLPRAEWPQRLPNWTAFITLGNEPAWTYPLAQALANGLCVWLPQDASPADADLPRTLTYPAGDMQTLADWFHPAQVGRRNRAQAAGSALLKKEAASGSIEQVIDALSIVRALPVRPQRMRGPSGLWPFAFYRRIHRMLAGSRK